MFSHRMVFNERTTDADTRMFQRLNKFIRDNPRVDISLLAIGDGVTFCYKR